MTEIVKFFVYLGGFLAYLISGNIIYLRALFLISILESMSKLCLDIIEGKLEKKRTIRIVLVKLWYIPLIMVFTQMDYVLLEMGKSFPVSATNASVLAILTFDSYRFIRNLEKIGVPIPKFILKLLNKISETINKG